ncbi:redoxin domain-containing protein [Edaphobacillus lindanitolerans]|uniref:Peroxiredoxin n=1 Tax=Edaphobacillus lindanitolerans TaxID=550447 RepID=A0A1U7PLN3_9BACI|nr:redoxin domain-containing protein [Edaphobacillus lindanitolerans]SIT69067.1 Peroxiredoxin [Edaphobacillus lindanitolerans]
MNKKVFGSIVALVIIGTLVAIMVRDATGEEFNGRQKQLERQLEEAGQTETVSDDEEAVGIRPGEAAPDFTLQKLDGGEMSLSDFRGKKVILNFWASWCGPCRSEMPHMENFYKQEAKKLGVEILAVNLSASERGSDEKVMENITNFVGEFGMTFPVLLDKDGKQGDIYQAISIPTSYIIDSSGVVRQMVRGPMDEKMMRELAESIE